MKEIPKSSIQLNLNYRLINQLKQKAQKKIFFCLGFSLGENLA